MKVLKILARVFFILSVIALTVGLLVQAINYSQALYLTSSSSSSSSRVFNNFVVVEPLIIFALLIGVVSDFVEGYPVFKKIGLALLISSAIGIANVGFISLEYFFIVSYGFITLGLLFNFVCYLISKGENGDSGNLELKVERLQKIHSLLEDKIITQEEYDEMRTKILGLPKKRK